MQLKRDTDFAIRILYCFNQNHDAFDAPDASGLTLSEIAMQTGTPKTAVGRLCEKLEDKGILSLRHGQETSEKIYDPCPALLDVTLLNVIEAVEETGEIFAVLDKRSVAYSGCEAQIQRIQKSIERILDKTTLRILFGIKGGST